MFVFEYYFNKKDFYYFWEISWKKKTFCIQSQLVSTCSKSIIKTPEQFMKFFYS